MCSNRNIKSKNSSPASCVLVSPPPPITPFASRLCTGCLISYWFLFKIAPVTELLDIYFIFEGRKIRTI